MVRIRRCVFGGPFVFGGSGLKSRNFISGQGCLREGKDMGWPAEDGVGIVEEMGGIDNLHDDIARVGFDRKRPFLVLLLLLLLLRLLGLLVLLELLIRLLVLGLLL